MSRLPFDLADASSDHAWQQLKAFLGDRIEDGVSGILVDGHDPASYARVLAGLFTSPGLRARLAHGAVQHASRFGWGLTVDRLLTVYAGAMSTSLVPPSYTRAG